MEISHEVRDIFTELINTGIGRAAASISELLNMEVILSLPYLKIMTPQELMAYMPGKDWTECVTVIQRFQGGLAGKGIVSFPVIKGKTLVNLILGDPMNDEETLNVLEREAIAEVGNMIINAVGCTIADMANEEIKSQLPEVRISDSIIEMDEEISQSIYIIGETNFFVKDNNIEGTIILVFSYGNFEKLINKFLQ